MISASLSKTAPCVEGRRVLAQTFARIESEKRDVTGDFLDNLPADDRAILVIHKVNDPDRLLAGQSLVFGQVMEFNASAVTASRR